MKTNDIREKFLQYFEGHGHQRVASSRLIPDNDPTLLFNNAGMNQFKNVFLGYDKRDYSRATSSQKCVRAGGKHNDLENVGFTARHHTFFEMLGNFSFGDYFKKEAIHYAWDFITRELGIPKDRLYVTVFDTDDDAADIWHKQENVPSDRIFRFGEKDNFWRMGDTGPCGPCSEIFFDLGPDVPGNPKDNVMGGEGDRFMEIWNLVFMQYNETENGRKDLPNPSIDTGAGLERLAVVMQDQINNYHTDTFQAIINSVAGPAGHQYAMPGDLKGLKGEELRLADSHNVAFRVLADHARASAFLIADGVLPSNEGRGYVLRRIMRRAIRYGRQLSESTSLLSIAVEALINEMGGVYPELVEQRTLVTRTVKDEEERFLKTLGQGIQILEDELKQLKNAGSKRVSGETVFKLYDTFGFPVDLTRLMANEQGFEVDESEFEQRMQAAKEKAKASWKGKGLAADTAHLIQTSQKILNSSGATHFLGYDGTDSQGEVIFLSTGTEATEALSSGQSGWVALDKTSFYAESGGQAGDTGTLTTSGGQAEVLDCIKHNDIHLLSVKITDGILKNGDAAQQSVTGSTRRNTSANHSATHLMHAALKKVLGEHVTQAGSLVEPDRLRFDFTHNEPMSMQQVFEVENMVNREISAARQVSTDVMTPDEAKSAGAMALFGEKYGDKVRVVTMGDFSMELCGGVHVSNTVDIRLFKIVSEAGVSSGVRRIEALTGDRAVEFALKHTRESLAARDKAGIKEGYNQYLEGAASTMSDWIDKSRQEYKDLQKKIHQVQGGQIDINKYISDATAFSSDSGSGKLVLADIDLDDRKILSELGDKIRDKIQTGIVVIVGKGIDDSHPIIVNVTKDLTKSFNAGKIIREMANEMGGKGGGRPDFAQGAGKDRGKIAEAFAAVGKIVN